MRPGTTVSPVRQFCDTVFRDQYGNPDPSLEPTFDEATGKLGIWWHDSNGTRTAFHDDYW